jgi:hypothetical protein
MRRPIMATKLKNKPKKSARPSAAANGHPQTYADGHPLDVVQYLECKLILKPDRFDSMRGFYEFNELVREAAGKVDKVKYEALNLKGRRPSMREVRFVDTADFRLYNNAYILRRRIPYEDGFPVGDPEIVFKFREADPQKAAKADIRPKIFGKYRIKFKAEALPLKDQVGGYRLLFSHNVQFPLSAVHDPDRTNLKTLVKVLPILGGIIGSEEGRVSLVNQTLVEEVLLDLGTLDFGKGVTADANIALWRNLGDHSVMCGEFAFELKFNRKEDVAQKARDRAEQFFVTLQLIAQSWLYLGCTKTALVYRLKGNPPQSHE